MTKKDYILIAGVLLRLSYNIRFQQTKTRSIGYEQAVCDAVIEFGRELEKENPRFDFDRFVKAANGR